MAEAFDPYHVWLAIPPAEQPPNHYRLLGLPLFEDNSETIEHAADQRMLLLRTFQSGKNAAEAVKLLNAVATARVWLLNPEKKATYDRQLHAALQPQPAGSAASAGEETVDWTGLQPLDNYRLIEKLGEGGMGAVFKAIHTKLDRVVAVKLLRSDHAWDERAAARFDREMRAAGAVDHPNVVRALDAGEIDGTRFLAMEYVDGLTATALVSRCHPLPIADACEIIRQAALGLHAVHEHNLIHRDIKTSNLMVGRDGTVKLLDLGLARFHREGPRDEGMTGTGQAMGTIDFMAPEQLAESHSVDIRADIYSLGCTLYALLAGHPPFATGEYEGTLRKAMAQVERPVPPISKLRSDTPPELARIVGRMLEKDPAKRFAVPSEVADALGPLTIGRDLPKLVAEAEHRPVPPVQGTADTRGSSSSGLTKFLEGIKGSTTGPTGTTVGTKRLGKSWGKLAMLSACLAVAVLSMAAVLTMALRDRSRRAEEATALVLDWPAEERAGAVVSIDGREAAVSPSGTLRYPCLPGRHLVRIKRPEFKPFEQMVLIQAGRESWLRPVWLPQSYLILQWRLAEQRDARVEIDGTATDLSLLVRRDNPEEIRVPIEPGPHKLWIVRRGYEPFEKRMMIHAGESVTVEPDFKGSVPMPAIEPSPPAAEPAVPQAPKPEPAAIAAEPPQPPAPAPPPTPPQLDPALKRQ